MIHSDPVSQKNNIQLVFSRRSTVLTNLETSIPNRHQLSNAPVKIDFSG